jgi:uncharacterized protein YccT (UPF0319 family)
MRLALIFFTFLMSFSVNASVIIFPENIIVVSVNGIEHSSSFFTRETQLDFPIGKHVVVLKYQDLFEGDDDHTKVKSKPFVVLFSLDESSASDDEISVVTPNLDELKQAKMFAKSPKIKLFAENGDEITTVNQSLIKFNAQGQFVKLANDTKSDILSDNVTANSQINHKRSTRKVSCCNINQESGEESDLERLKCLWKKTNKAEQEAFIYFVLAQQQAAIQSLKGNK